MPGRAPHVLVIVLVALASPPLVAPARAQIDPRYAPPVDLPVSDPFRAPATIYGPGNRGLEYATPPGTAVRAAGDGVVVFAGSVAGSLHLTIGHPDGLRTSYSFLARLDVVVGQAVRRGQPVGTTTDRLHVGVRDPEGTYLDPARLFDGTLAGRARLVPGADEGATALARRERVGFLRLVLERGAAFAGDRFGDARLALHYAVELRPDVRLSHVVANLARLGAQQQRCTPAGLRPPPPRGPRVVVLVGGLGSTSEGAAIDGVDTGALGYAPGDVLRFSYEGALVPDASDAAAFAALPRHAYDATASTGDLELAAQRLGDVLRAVAAARPGVPIDVIAHSQGGLVARRALAASAARRALPDEVATLATIGTPHGGADLATAASAVGRTPGGAGSALAAFTTLDPSSPAVGQLSELSPFLRRLRADPLPERVHRVSIAARGDLVVAVPRTIDPDLPSAVVGLTGPRAHDELPSAPSTTVELGLVVGGRPPTCASLSQLVGDAVTGEAVSWATDAAGAAALAG